MRVEALNQSVQVTSVNTVNAASKDFREILDSEAISTELDDELRNMTKQSFYKVPYGNYKKSTINIGQSSEDEIDTGRYQIRRSNEDVEIYDKKTQQKFGWILRYGDEVQVDSQSNQKFLINDFGNGFFMMQYVDDELENGLKKFFDVDELPEKAELTLIIMLSKTKKVFTTHLTVLCSVALYKLFYNTTLTFITICAAS